MLGTITLALFFLLILWGNMVAGLEVGLACPDWPLCLGEVVPPFRWDVYMEFSHRVIGAVATGFLVVLSYKRFRSYTGAARAVPIAALALVAVEIVMGGMVVLLELPMSLTTVHFMVAIVIFMLVFYMMSFDGESSQPGFSVNGYAGLIAALLVLVICQATLGAYTRHAHAGMACGQEFPKCLGAWIPAMLKGPVLIHYSHRIVAYVLLLTIAGFTVAVMAPSGLSNERARPLKNSALLLLGLYIMQVVMGAGVVMSKLHFVTTAIHLVIALVMMILLGRMWVSQLKIIEGRG